MFGIHRSIAAGLATAGLVLGAAVAVTAQPSPDRPRGPRYDMATEVTVSGVVQAVETIAPPGRGRRGLGGMHLQVKAAGDVLDVHLGPTAFLESKKVTLAAGDTVEIVGSKVTVDGEPAWLARTVKKGDQTWTLRDAAGLPLWRGRTRR
ncbi:MAG: hypothetical protein R2708_07045 [Vicinamibacterales bacterium]